MVEGISRWEENYQGNHINNVLSKLELGKIYQKKSNPQNLKEAKINKISRSKENESVFDKLRRCAIASPKFNKRRLEIAELQEKATQ